MVDKKFKDFDAAVSEADGEKVTFRIAGEDYELPGQLPARVVLTQMKLMDGEGAMDANSLPLWLEQAGCPAGSYPQRRGLQLV